MNKIPLLAVLKLINKMIKMDTVTVSGKDGYKWSFKMDEINKLKQMNEINEQLKCRPCGLHGKKECPEKHFNCGFKIEI